MSPGSKIVLSVLIAGLLFHSPQALWAQEPLVRTSRENISPPIRLSIVNSVRLSSEVFRLGSRLRIRNVSSGQQVIIDISEQEPYVPAHVLSRLVSSPDQEWLPEFSVLTGATRSDSAQVVPPALRVRSSVLQSQGQRPTAEGAPLTWRVLGYRALRSSTGYTYLEVSDGLKTHFVSAEQARRRIQFAERRNLEQLFDLAWRAVGIQRYDLAYEGFGRILARERHMNDEQKAQAHLGFALSAYHQEGCTANVDKNLVEADRDPNNRKDVSYYRALCAMNREDYRAAELLFRDLASEQHPLYAETSTFYLGIIAESAERFAEAETAYLDTIDFASDPSLAQMAQQRLENVRILKDVSNYQTKWITGGFNLGIGYDNNVIALPAELSPASYGLDKESSIVSTNVAFLSLAPPWSRSFAQRINYNFLFSKHFSEEISGIYDSHIHDVGTQFQFNSSIRKAHSVGYSWSSISLGSLGSSEETLRTHSAFYNLRLLAGTNPAQPDYIQEITFRYVGIRPVLDAIRPENNLESNAYTLSYKFTEKRDAPYSYGPQVSVELRPSKGRENSLRDFRLGGFWDYFFGAPATPWYINATGHFSYKPYYQSALNRHDYALSSSLSLGRYWSSTFDTKLQYTGNLNFSTLKAFYQFRQSSISLLVTAYF